MRVAMIGCGVCRPGVGGVFCRFRARRQLRRQGPGQDRRRCGAARCRSSSRGCRISWPTNVREGRLSFTTDLTEAGARRPTRCSSPSARPRGAATATPTSPTSIRRRARSRRRIDGYTVVVDEIDRAGRHRRRGRAHHPRGAARCRLRRGLQPGIPARGRGDRRLQAARPHRHRHRGRARRRGDDASSTARSTSTRRRSWSPRGARRN